MNDGQFEGNVGRQISGDPKVGISGTLSAAPPTKSASPSSTVPPVATSPVKTVTASAAKALPDVVVITATVTQGVAANQASSLAEASKTEKDPNPTTGPFWGKLKTSGTSDSPYFYVLRGRGGSARLEVSLCMAMLGVVVAIAFVCL